MGKQNKNIFDCQGGDFSLKSLDDSFDAEDGEWYPDNSDETDLVLAASLCKNNAVKKEKKKKDSNFSIDIRFSFSTKIVKKVYKP